MKKQTIGSATQQEELLKHIAKFVHDIRTPLLSLSVNSDEATELMEILLPTYKHQNDSNTATHETRLSEQEQLCQNIKTINTYARKSDEIVNEFWTQTLLLLGKSSNCSTPQSAAEESHYSQNNRSTEGNSVLLVDDDEFNQQVGLEMLKELGFDVTIASNGIQALQTLESESFRFILMDCRLPELDGWDTTKEIRNNQQNTTIPIIGLTASLDHNDYNRATEAGMNDCLSKPLSIDALARIVDIYVS